MAAKRNTNPTRKVEFRIPMPSYAQLEFLTRFGQYGGTPGEVARFLMNDTPLFTRNLAQIQRNPVRRDL